MKKPSRSPRRSPRAGTPARASQMTAIDGACPSASNDVEEVARLLSTDLRAGLSSEEAAVRLAEVGKNVLRGGGPPPLLKIIFQ